MDITFTEAPCSNVAGVPSLQIQRKEMIALCSLKMPIAPGSMGTNEMLSTTLMLLLALCCRFSHSYDIFPQWCISIIIPQ